MVRGHGVTLANKSPQNSTDHPMRISTLSFLLMLTCVGGSASAQTVIEIEGQKPATPQAQEQSNPSPAMMAQPQESAPAPQPAARFSFNRVENGFLRLDSENGQIA